MAQQAQLIRRKAIEPNIVEIFKEKMFENPYLNEIAEYFIIDVESQQYNSQGELVDGSIDEEPPLNPDDIQISPIRISTMVVLCSLGIDISLDLLYEHLACPYYNEEHDYSIEGIDYGYRQSKGNIPTKSTNKKKKKTLLQNNTSTPAKPVKKRESFYNQVTVIFKYVKCINVKVFRNGSIHITGLVDIEQGKRAIGFLGDEIRKIYAKDSNITKGNIDDLGIHNWNVVLINSDFAGNFKIRRERLYEILENEYNLVVNYESDSYPGVKTSFYWNQRDKGTLIDPENDIYDGKKTGICQCNSGLTCDGTGLGSMAEGDCCRKITISVFQSSKCIITGARNVAQINECYEFITNIFRKHYNEIAR